MLSKAFKVVIGQKSKKVLYEQTWANNMRKSNEPKVENDAIISEDSTTITVCFDLKKFGIDLLSDEIIGLIKKKIIDRCYFAKNVGLSIDGTEVKINNFKRYCELFQTNEFNNTMVYEKLADNFKVAIKYSDRGFQQISSVNGNHAIEGGTHIDFALGLFVNSLMDDFNNDNQQIQFDVGKIKENVAIFVECKIKEPSWSNSQKSFIKQLTTSDVGNKIRLTANTIEFLNSSGILPKLMATNSTGPGYFEQNSRKNDLEKQFPDVLDAHRAGSEQRSALSSLIVCEGDSAMGFVRFGLKEADRDYIGAMPMMGKVLNVQKASEARAMANKELDALSKILGLEYGIDYENVEARKKLRYARLLILPDSDTDGFHFLTTLVNFFLYFWPELLRHKPEDTPFIQFLILPAAIARKKSTTIYFYSITSFNSWKQTTTNANQFIVRMPNSPGGLMPIDSEYYVTNLELHVISFQSCDGNDADSINKAFSKKKIEARKFWLNQYMKNQNVNQTKASFEEFIEQKREDTFDLDNNTSIKINDFLDQYLLQFYREDNLRSIPSIMDGCKNVERKIIFTSLKVFRNNLKDHMKVDSFAGIVTKETNYSHSQTNLSNYIIGLSQYYAGSNNLNLLTLHGMPGSRKSNGEDSSQSRYDEVRLSKITQFLFPVEDDVLMHFLRQNDKLVEPQYLFPILPLALLNKCSGIGTGFSTQIPNYNVVDLINNMVNMINENPLTKMTPSYNGFRGVIVQLDKDTFGTFGEIALVATNRIEITELPIGTSIEDCREFLRSLKRGNRVNSELPSIIHFEEHHSSDNIKFVIFVDSTVMSELRKSTHLHETFKLETLIRTSNMHLISPQGEVKKYESVDEIMKEFFEERKKVYERRTNAVIQKQLATLNQLNIKEQLMDRPSKPQFGKKDGAGMAAWLKGQGFPPDPLLIWEREQKRTNSIEQKDGVFEKIVSNEEEDNNDIQFYQYLFNYISKKEIENERINLDNQRKKAEGVIKLAEESNWKELWLADLKNLKKAIEEKEKEDDQNLFVALGKEGYQKLQNHGFSDNAFQVPPNEESLKSKLPKPSTKKKSTKSTLIHPLAFEPSRLREMIASLDEQDDRHQMTTTTDATVATEESDLDNNELTHTNPNCTIFVGNLHKKVTEELVRELFEQYGQISKVVLKKDLDGHFIGFGFVEFVPSPQLNLEVICEQIRDKAILCGHKFVVDLCKGRRTQERFPTPTFNDRGRGRGRGGSRGRGRGGSRGEKSWPKKRGDSSRSSMSSNFSNESRHSSSSRYSNSNQGDRYQDESSSDSRRNSFSSNYDQKSQYHGERSDSSSRSSTRDNDRKKRRE